MKRDLKSFPDNYQIRFLTRVHDKPNFVWNYAVSQMINIRIKSSSLNFVTFCQVTWLWWERACLNCAYRWGHRPEMMRSDWLRAWPWISWPLNIWKTRNEFVLTKSKQSNRIIALSCQLNQICWFFSSRNYFSFK